jgi:hypothetical protein
MSRKYRVMVIDDEESARKLMKAAIDWESLNMEVVGEAASGIEAVNIIVDAYGRYPCFPDTSEDAPYKGLIADSISKEYSTVEVIEVGEVEYIELACIVSWIAYSTAERYKGRDIESEFCGRRRYAIEYRALIALIDFLDY